MPGHQGFNGLIFRRALTRLGTAFGIRGGFKGPDRIRSESGLYLMTDVMESLSQGESSFGFSTASATAGAASTTARAELLFEELRIVTCITATIDVTTNLSFVSVKWLDTIGGLNTPLLVTGAVTGFQFDTAPAAIRWLDMRDVGPGRIFPFILPKGEALELVVRTDGVGAASEVTMHVGTVSGPEGIRLLQP